MAINLKTKKSRLRFLETKIHLIPFKTTHLEKLENEKAMIHDRIIQVVGEMNYQEVNSISGKLLLEGRLKNELNSYFGIPIVKEIYFSHFVVQ